MTRAARYRRRVRGAAGCIPEVHSRVVRSHRHPARPDAMKRSLQTQHSARALMCDICSRSAFHRLCQVTSIRTPSGRSRLIVEYARCAVAGEIAQPARLRLLLVEGSSNSRCADAREVRGRRFAHGRSRRICGPGPRPTSACREEEPARWIYWGGVRQADIVGTFVPGLRLPVSSALDLALN